MPDLVQYPTTILLQDQDLNQNHNNVQMTSNHTLHLNSLNQPQLHHVQELQV